MEKNRKLRAIGKESRNELMIKNIDRLPTNSIDSLQESDIP
jgi:hypothetical protein